MGQLLDLLQARAELQTATGPVSYYRLDRLKELGIGDPSRLPFSIKVLLESALRHYDEKVVRQRDVAALANWEPAQSQPVEIPFKPARVVLQDFTGVPAVVDLAAMRAAVARLGGNPARINPIVPVDLVIDHSVQVDYFGSDQALMLNNQIDFDRNRERYEFLRWGQQAFDNLRIVPPSMGIVHQVNLEYLARVVFEQTVDGMRLAYPDSLVGTDSHTTMINGLGVVGWGVGGIEAEASMLAQPIYMLTPEVIGFKLIGKLTEGTTATDLVLTVTEMLRKKGVVGKFVEFYGPGLSQMSLPDRATISNMAPEYGATMGFFPVDAETLRYLRLTGREKLCELVEAYCKVQGLFRTDDSPEPIYTDTLELDLGSVVPSLAGPKRPQDRIALTQVKQNFQETLQAAPEKRGFGLTPDQLQATAMLPQNGHSAAMKHGAVVIAAITSCTNTSNPSVMVAAGLVAKKAAERGLTVKPWVKTSLAPGSRVVTNYLVNAGLQAPLDKLGFQTVGYGCTTCIGNSGPLPEPVANAVTGGDLVAAAVLSGNRNFEGRVHPLVKANYLASPPLVVAYALAGTVDIDLLNEPLGQDEQGHPVYLKDIWPTNQEIHDTITQSLNSEMYRSRYANVFDANEEWNRIAISGGQLYEWNPQSTYIQEPPFFKDLQPEPAKLGNIKQARVLALLGDSVTTDHISPAGSIKSDSPAGLFLQAAGVPPKEFNSYGARRGNDLVMTRGTFANIRIRNLLLDGVEGGFTKYLPTDDVLPIYDAAMKYQEAGTPTIIIAGSEYGTGSSRDWAAKGTLLLGVKAVLAASFERIHRSNLVGMGVLPLQFRDGQNAQSLGLTGTETYDLIGIHDNLEPQQEISVLAKSTDGSVTEFNVLCRIDTPIEVEYYRYGGIMPYVLSQMMRQS